MFYAEACRGVDTILELGCGAGRILSALKHQASLALGLDTHLDLLRRASLAGCSVIAADMSAFKFRQKFERILIPYNGFYCLTSQTAQLACLRCVAEHLAADGELIVDGYRTAPLGGDEVIHQAFEFVDEIHLGDECWEVREASSVWPDKQYVEATYRHLNHITGEMIDACIAQRYLKAQEVPQLLADAGLTLRALHGGFNRESFDDDSEHLVIRARLSSY